MVNISTTINAQTKIILAPEKLAEFIHGQVFPNEYTAQIFNFYMDCPIQDISAFAAQYHISDMDLKKYYESYIKDYYINWELEDMLSYVEKSSQDSP